MSTDLLSPSAPGQEAAPTPAGWQTTPVEAGGPRILVVDDEPPIVDLVAGYLVREGWEVRTSGDGIAALEIIRTWNPDAIVLDLMLPSIDGLEVCTRMRAFSDAYVLMLTARTEVIDRVVGLAVGADDYLTKPFSPRELVARIKALQRRPRSSAIGAAGTPGSVPAGLEMDGPRRLVRVDGEPVELTALEFNLLATLAREPGIVVTRQRLLDQVWGVGYVAERHLVDVHVANVRRKLGDDPSNPRFVETVRGVGYRVREATG